MSRKTDALFQRALAHAAAGDPQSAIADLARVLRREPTQPAASIKIAEIEMVLDHYPVAMEHLERILRINPDNVPALGLLAAGCCDCGLPDRAREYAARALRAAPADSHAAVVLARAYRLLHCLDDAEQALEAALRVSNGDAYAEGQVHAERAALLEMRGDFDRALDHFRRATQMAPGLDVARQGYATALLREGRFDEGWREFDRGRERRRIRAQLPAVPAEFLWDGTADLAGQQIVLVDELGFGDAIQFFRYLPRIRALGARIVHVTMPHLVPLLSVAAPHAECVSALTLSTRFDWLAFTSSLPGLFRTQPDSIPAEVPYLHAAADRIARWALPPGMAGAYRVGLVWAGNPRHPGDRWRSIPPAVVLALADVPGAVFCSLQPDVRADGLAAMEAYPKVHRIGAAAGDFADTAAIVAQLDLVITVDTAMAHLAGAMATPVWILLPPVPDWRWQRNRSDSPWYPTARLFRQQASEDWGAVIARVRQALIETIASVPARER